MVEVAHLKRRWLRFNPGSLPAILLAVEGLLWLSNRFSCPAWHKGYAVLSVMAMVGVAILLTLLWCIVAIAFRLRFQYSLRSLLGLVTAAAIACSWLSGEMKSARIQKEALDQITLDQHNGVVCDPASMYTVYMFDEKGCNPLGKYAWRTSWRVDASPDGPVSLRRLLGDLFFDDGRAAYLYGDGQTELLGSFPQLVKLVIDKGSDAGLQNLARLVRLRSLCLLSFSENVTDVTIERLRGLTNLRALNLADSNVSSAGLEHLQSLDKLQILTLPESTTDEDLQHLKGLCHLRCLKLYDTKVTEHGVKMLRQALANCDVVTFRSNEGGAATDADALRGVEIWPFDAAVQQP